MAYISATTREVSDMDTEASVSDNTAIIVNDGSGMKKITVGNLKRQMVPTPSVRVTARSGSTVTATDGTSMVTAIIPAGETYVDLRLPGYGTYTVTATLGDLTKTKTLETDTVKRYELNMRHENIYGIRRAIASESTAWERIDDSVGFTATASVGTVAGSSDFDDKLPWSGMVRSTFDTGDVMVHIPEFWFRREVADGVDTIQIADVATEGFTKHPGSGKYIGAYKTSAGNKSVSGAAPLVRQTRATMRTNAKAKGAGWGLADMATRFAMQFLYLVEYADNNYQAKIGRGYSDSHSSAINVGSCDSVPNLTGRPAGTDGSTDTVYRGIEGLVGNVWEWLDGLNFKDGIFYVSTDPSTYADDTATGYTALSYNGATNWSQSYITKMGYDPGNPWAFLPEAAGSGGETKYFADAVWSNTGWRVCYVGGSWGHGSLYGLFALDVSLASSYSDASIGSRLLYSPS